MFGSRILRTQIQFEKNIQKDIHVLVYGKL